MGNSYTNLIYHIVFSTRERTPAISGDGRERLYEYMGAIVRGERGALLEIGGMPDHIHLLARFRSDASVAVMVRQIKAHSSGWINDQRVLPDWRGWQAGYGAFSVSESQVPAVRRYICNQETHHARASFQDELIGLLKKHRIEYDERHLLG